VPKPFHLSSVVGFGTGPLSAEALNLDEQQATASVPSNVLAAWDAYRTTIGQTVPYNVNRARALSAGYAKIVA
jgi:hypothetical protein